jgi:hypothetical protein
LGERRATKSHVRFLTHARACARVPELSSIIVKRNAAHIFMIHKLSKVPTGAALLPLQSLTTFTHTLSYLSPTDTLLVTALSSVCSIAVVAAHGQQQPPPPAAPPQQLRHSPPPASPPPPPHPARAAVRRRRRPRAHAHQTVSAWWPCICSVQRQLTSSMSRKTCMSAGKTFCGMQGHSSGGFSSAVLLLQSGS